MKIGRIVVCCQLLSKKCNNVHCRNDQLCESFNNNIPYEYKSNLIFSVLST